MERPYHEHAGESPGDGLLHPLPLFAILVLVVNDHVLKLHFAGFLTGKLSDIAGLAFFPCMLESAYEQLRFRAAAFAPSSRVTAWCVLVTGLVFSAVQLWEPASEAYATAWACCSGRCGHSARGRPCRSSR
jgi:hypothetical protein